MIYKKGDKRGVKDREFWYTARIGAENDKRRKITDEDKAYIKKLHKEGESIREIARIMEKICSRRSIQYILYPERLEVVKARQKEVKRWEKYNTKELRLEVMRKYRERIRKVHKLK